MPDSIVTCPKCGKELYAPSSALGKGCRCPSCKQTFLIRLSIDAPGLKVPDNLMNALFAPPVESTSPAAATESTTTAQLPANAPSAGGGKKNQPVNSSTKSGMPAIKDTKGSGETKSGMKVVNDSKASKSAADSKVGVKSPAEAKPPKPEPVSISDSIPDLPAPPGKSASPVAPAAPAPVAEKAVPKPDAAAKSGAKPILNSPSPAAKQDTKAGMKPPPVKQDPAAKSGVKPIEQKADAKAASDLKSPPVKDDQQDKGSWQNDMLKAIADLGGMNGKKG